MSIIIQYLFISGIFHLFNHTLIGNFVKAPILLRFNKAKVQPSSKKEKVIYHLLYPLFCSFCFGFWANLFLSMSLTISFAGAIVALVVELTLKKLSYAE